MISARLIVKQRSALALLAGAGTKGLTETIMFVRGFTRAMLSFLVRKGLATARGKLSRQEEGRLRLAASGLRPLVGGARRLIERGRESPPEAR
jgi:hypothetical protein